MRCRSNLPDWVQSNHFASFVMNREKVRQRGAAEIIEVSILLPIIINMIFTFISCMLLTPSHQATISSPHQIALASDTRGGVECTLYSDIDFGLGPTYPVSWLSIAFYIHIFHWISHYLYFFSNSMVFFGVFSGTFTKVHTQQSEVEHFYG